jgi:hypothetical protein
MDTLCVRMRLSCRGLFESRSSLSRASGLVKVFPLYSFFLTFIVGVSQVRSFGEKKKKFFSATGFSRSFSIKTFFIRSGAPLYLRRVTSPNDHAL